MDYGFTLDPGESIIRIVHRSIFDLLPTLFLALILATVAGGLVYIQIKFPNSSPFPPALLAGIVAIMLLIAAIIVVVGLYVFERNVLIFTNTHLIIIEQLALFQNRVSQLNFEKVEDVTGRKTGFLQAVFNYGNVEIQSASEQEKFIFKNAPDPQGVADEALQHHEECMRLLQTNSGLAPNTASVPPPVTTPTP
jgi:hypothetical protein